MFIVVFVTVPDLKTAKKITKGLLAKKLCACVNIVKDIESFFWWQGKIDKAAELLLIIKTQKKLFKKLEKAILTLHPYQTVEIIALPIVLVNKKYASWIKQETKNG